MAVEEPIELVFAILGPEAEANEALQRLIGLNRSGEVELISAMVVAKDEKGQVDIEETPDLLKAEAPLKGILAHSRGGLVAGMTRVLAEAVAGAVLGLAKSPAAKVGVADHHLERLAEELTPGTSALLALVEEEALETVVRELDPLIQDVRRFVLESEATAPAVGNGG